VLFALAAALISSGDVKLREIEIKSVTFDLITYFFFESVLYESSIGYNKKGNTIERKPTNIREEKRLNVFSSPSDDFSKNKILFSSFLNGNSLQKKYKT